MRILIGALTWFLCTSTLVSAKTEILWDTYGVPHVFAPSRESMFYAHGWAQMRNQANLLLLLYGQSRGRSAEYWGQEYLALDRWVQTNGVPERAQEWYAAQEPAFRTYLDAFARGINDFGRKHPELIDAKYRVVLPVSGADVVGHALRVVQYMYMGSEGELKKEVDLFRGQALQSRLEMQEPPEGQPGSNTWALGPAKSASGHPLLLINPHLAWGNTFYRYMEVHLTAPDYDLYGAPQIGFPVPVVGFNRKAGWGRTVNTLDTVDFYRLIVKDGKYEFDSTWRDFEQHTKTLKCRLPDGTLRTEQLTIRKTVQGPVVYDQNGLTIAMKVVGLDRPKMLEQWFRMGEAQNLKQFQDALRMSSVPMWNANYADADGHILLVDNGLLPRRGTGSYGFWTNLVPGNTSKTLWTGYHSYDELPKTLDPASGFTQNENEAPWFMTQPLLKPAGYPPYFGPGLEFMPTYRTKRSLRILTGTQRMTYEEFVANKHATRMEAADSVLDDLLEVTERSQEPELKAARSVLSQWDRQTEAESRGAVLFEMFFNQYFGAAGPIGERLRVHYDPADFVHSAYGLAERDRALTALKSAAEECQRLYGRLDVPWGEVYRFASGTVDVPANGANGRLGVFRTITYGPKQGGRAYATHGETFVCGIEFGTPQRAGCVLSYGNSSQPGSKHLVDQLPLMVQKRLHPVWRDRQEVESHSELAETIQ